MKLTINTSAIQNLLATTVRAIPTRQTHLAQSCLILTANLASQKLEIKAFNFSLGIEAWGDCHISTGGAIALPAKLFNSAISGLPPGEIDILTEDNEATITYATGRCKIRGISDIEDFPEIPDVADECTRISMPGALLKLAIGSTLFAASHDDTKQVLCGIHFSFTKTAWEAAATDSHRLAIAWGNLAELGNTLKNECAVTIPYQTFIELEKILGLCPENSNCTISLDDSIVVFDLPNVKVTSRLLEGQYPAYRTLLPRSFNHSFVADKGVFTEALKRTSFINQNQPTVCQFEESQAYIFSESTEVGSAVEKIPLKADSTTSKMTIAFNSKYLGDCFRHIPTDEVCIKANQPTYPVVFYPVGGIIDSCILVMPVQLRSANAAIPVASETSKEPISALPPQKEQKVTKKAKKVFA